MQARAEQSLGEAGMNAEQMPPALLPDLLRIPGEFWGLRDTGAVAHDVLIDHQVQTASDDGRIELKEVANCLSVVPRI